MLFLKKPAKGPLKFEGAQRWQKGTDHSCQDRESLVQ